MITEKEIRIITEKYAYYLNHSYTDIALSKSGNHKHLTQSDRICIEQGLKLMLEEMQWGFPQQDKKGLLINARSEGIGEKNIFGESVRRRRCVIPASGYFEWDVRKNKVLFNRTDNKPIYMAGVYNLVDNAERFVVITTEANESVSNNAIDIGGGRNRYVDL